MSDEELAALLGGNKVEDVTNGMNLIARLLATFHNELKAQGLPDPVVLALVIEFYRKMMGGNR